MLIEDVRSAEALSEYNILSQTEIQRSITNKIECPAFSVLCAVCLCV